MNIKILYDNNSCNNKFQSDFGFSCLLDNKILFDTGTNADILLNNISAFNIEIPDIEAVVISHEHYDHAGGLFKLIELNPKLLVYICSSFSNEFKNKLKSITENIIQIKTYKKISGNIYTTGEIKGLYKNNIIYEQSILFDSSEGSTILTGCAHPGIINIIEKTNNNFNNSIKNIIGGFHLNKANTEEIHQIINKLETLGIEKTAPAHCTGEKAINIFKNKYKENYIETFTGCSLNI